MDPLRWIVTYGCKLGLRFAYRIEASEMAKIRREGPLILYTNHRAKVEAPIIYTFLQPRPRVTALSKAENWGNPFMGFVFKLWGIIPIRRGEADREALEASFGALAKGYILGIAPEGTRSPSGKLIRAQAGIAFLALRSGAPLQPLAHWLESPERRGPDLDRRPVFRIRVGEAFRIAARAGRTSKEERQEIADQIMYRLARLLPEELRGEYAEPGPAAEDRLIFEG